MMAVVLELDGRDHADLAVESAMVEPVDVLRGRDLEAGLVEALGVADGDVLDALVALWCVSPETSCPAC